MAGSTTHACAWPSNRAAQREETGAGRPRPSRSFFLGDYVCCRTWSVNSPSQIPAPSGGLRSSSPLIPGTVCPCLDESKCGSCLVCEFWRFLPLAQFTTDPAGHAYFSKGSRIRITSSRSGEVDSKATGLPTSSSRRRTYFTASPGNCVQLRAPRVDPFQPLTIS